jgi:clan AA aspartic protease
MSLTRTLIQLRNPVRPEQAALQVLALADTGAMYLCLPLDVAAQLGLSELERRDVTLADGSRRLVPYGGPVEVRFGNRRCVVGAMLMGDEVLLGAIPRSDLDLVIQPLTRTVVVNPASPDMPSSRA